ncbi:MAG: glycogen(starch) synthase [Arenicella sp.]|jgi:glycogen(starch) synthase
MRDKFAFSLIPNYELHLVGFGKSDSPEKKITNDGEIYNYPLFDFERTENKRWKASSQLWKLLKKIQPDLLIIHAVELLPVALLYKWRFGKKLIYDVQENYTRNIWYQKNYKVWQKPFLVFGISLIEMLSRVGVNHYILAEKCYQQELNFLLRKKNSILENKFLATYGDLKSSKAENNSIQSKQNTPLHFAYTGTISEIYGIREAVELIIKLQKSGLDLYFSIIGKVINEELKAWLENELGGLDWVSLTISLFPIPHEEIKQVLETTDFALLPYQPNKSTENCIPTKMYECLALQIPMIVQVNQTWEAFCEPHNASVFIDFANPNIGFLKNEIQQKTFFGNGKVEDAFWDGNELRELVEKVLGESD